MSAHCAFMLHPMPDAVHWPLALSHLPLVPQSASVPHWRVQVPVLHDAFANILQSSSVEQVGGVCVSAHTPELQERSPGKFAQSAAAEHWSALVLTISEHAESA